MVSRSPFFSLARPKNGPFFWYVAIVIVLLLVTLFIIFYEQGKMMNKVMSGKIMSLFFSFFFITLFIILLFFKVQGHGRFCGCFKCGDISFTFPIGDGFCGFPFVESVTTTTPTLIIYAENSSTMDATIQWDLLIKN
jgi:hypothetical protein